MTLRPPTSVARTVEIWGEIKRIDWINVFAFAPWALTLIYIGAVFLVALFVILPSPPAHYKAAKYLDRYTRISDSLLIAPDSRRFGDGKSLFDELPLIDAHYLKSPITAGEPITPKDLITATSLEIPDDIFLIDVTTEPDWATMNRGTCVEVWWDGAKTALRVPIFAIIPKGKAAWSILLRSEDIGPDGLGPAKSQAPLLRIVGLPEKAPRRCSMTSQAAPVAPTLDAAGKEQ